MKTPERGFLQALRGGALVADGGMGTQLYERGVLFSINFEELNLSRPELVRKIHEDYVRAGAQVLETNTFGANAIRLGRHGLEDKVQAINASAVRLAREAGGEHAYVAGAMGPSGLVFGGVEEELGRVRDAFASQAAALVEAGVDALIIETMRQPRELWLAIEAAREATGQRVPLVAQVTLDEDLAMADGTGISDVAEEMKRRGVDVIGVNCSAGPQDVYAALEKIVHLGVPLCAKPNAGLPRRVDDRFIYVSTPEYFGVYARRMFKLGVRMVGGCCGTTPEHIRRIAAAAKMAGGSSGGRGTNISQEEVARGSGDEFAHTVGGNFSSDQVPSRSATESTADAVVESYRHPSVPAGIRLVPTSEKGLFASQVGKRFVFSVEVNPPIGLNPERALQSAKMLTDGGVDVINIADGARAQARMSNLALATLMQNRLGIETLVHVCGRDRNLLGQVAHLLGAHALGIRNLVIVTGDPPKMGDFPDATAVYDLNSVGILRLASRLNRGVDPGGKPLGAATAFYCATGAEPAARNYAREIDRLGHKVAAGAELIMTQPVYDPAVLNRFLADVVPFGVPVLVGLLPLASSKNAEFLHNEVPGMQIPDAIRERMRSAGTGAEARKVGVAIAREMLDAVRTQVAGAYIMPPLEKYELALEVMDGFMDRPNSSATAPRP